MENKFKKRKQIVDELIMKESMKVYFYNLLLILLSPFILGIIIPISLLTVLDILIYNEIHFDKSFADFSNWIWNPFTMVFTIVIYSILWNEMRKKMKKMKLLNF